MRPLRWPPATKPSAWCDERWPPLKQPVKTKATHPNSLMPLGAGRGAGRGPLPLAAPS